jgi:hypothetical protein
MMDALPQFIEVAVQFDRACLAGRRFGKYHDIGGRELGALLPEAFADPALEPVAGDRGRDGLAGDRHTQPRLTAAVQADDGGQQLTVLATPGFEDDLEITGRQQARVAREARQGALSGNQPGATLRAAAGQNFAAADGGHAGAESVRTLAPCVVRLERAFHNRYSSMHKKAAECSVGIAGVQASLARRSPRALPELWITWTAAAKLAASPRFPPVPFPHEHC